MRYIVAIIFALMFASGGLHAQTRSSLLKGAKTYYLQIQTGPSCPGVTEDYIRRKLSFPFSYSSLQSVHGAAGQGKGGAYVRHTARGNETG